MYGSIVLLCGPHPPQKHTWTKGLTLKNFDDHARHNEKLVKELQDLSGAWGISSGVVVVCVYVGGWVGGFSGRFEGRRAFCPGQGGGRCGLSDRC